MLRGKLSCKGAGKEKGGKKRGNRNIRAGIRNRGTSHTFSKSRSSSSWCFYDCATVSVINWLHVLKLFVPRRYGGRYRKFRMSPVPPYIPCQVIELFISSDSLRATIFSPPTACLESKNRAVKGVPSTVSGTRNQLFIFFPNIFHTMQIPNEV